MHILKPFLLILRVKGAVFPLLFTRIAIVICIWEFFSLMYMHLPNLHLLKFELMYAYTYKIGIFTYLHFCIFYNAKCGTGTIGTIYVF